MPPPGSHQVGSADPRDRQIEDLRSRLDDVSQQLLQARDAVIGAEAELSASKARTAELEHHLHVRIIEVTELQNKVLELSAGQAVPERANPLAKRFSPLLARTARSPQ